MLAVPGPRRGIIDAQAFGTAGLPDNVINFISGQAVKLEAVICQQFGCFCRQIGDGLLVFQIMSDTEAVQLVDGLNGGQLGAGVILTRVGCGCHLFGVVCVVGRLAFHVPNIYADAATCPALPYFLTWGGWCGVGCSAVAEGVELTAADLTW